MIAWLHCVYVKSTYLYVRLHEDDAHACNIDHSAHPIIAHCDIIAVILRHLVCCARSVYMYSRCTHSSGDCLFELFSSCKQPLAQWPCANSIGLEALHDYI